MWEAEPDFGEGVETEVLQLVCGGELLPPPALGDALKLVLELGLAVWAQGEGWQRCQQSWRGL